MKPYKFHVGGYDDEDTKTRWGRKAARRGLKVVILGELSDHLVPIEKVHDESTCHICYEEYYGRKAPNTGNNENP